MQSDSLSTTHGPDNSTKRRRETIADHSLAFVDPDTRRCLSGAAVE
jgi:hypothetical protein